MEIREARESPAVLNVMVAGFNGKEPFEVPMKRPVHPCDDICVPLQADVLEHLVLFIRHYGITEGELTMKRNYKSCGPDLPSGIWASKVGFIVKVPPAMGMQQKFKRVRTVGDATSFLAEDGPQPIADIQQEHQEDASLEGSQQSSGDESVAPLPDDDADNVGHSVDDDEHEHSDTM